MRRATRVLAVAALATTLFVLPGHRTARAGGNIETLDTGNNIINAAWDTRAFPITWFINVGGGFSASQLRPELEGALDSWQNLPDNDWAFTYGGAIGSPFNDAAADGRNVAVFGASFGSAPGFIGVTPCTAITADQIVGDTGGPPPDVLGDGLGWLRLGATSILLVPTGTYPAGTVVDCDTVFNTAAVCSTDGSTICDPGNFNPVQDCFSPSATCNPVIPFTLNQTAGTEDVQGIALHEFGHFGTLAHSTLPDAIMYPFADSNPSGGGPGSNRILKQDDISSAAHYYKDANFDTNNGMITGRVTIRVDDDNNPGGPPYNATIVGGDGVPVIAMDAATLEPVAMRFSYSLFMAPTDPFDGADRSTFGDGFYRLEVPPGDYVVYTEWLDGTDEGVLGNRLYQRHNLSSQLSAVADGDSADFAGFYELLPERFEFHNTGESNDGGDGSTPGAAVDNPDAAAVISVAAGETASGVDIAINLDQDITKGTAARSDPTGVGRVDMTPINELALLLLDDDGNDDDWWLPHFSAADLPTPPYNVFEAVWTKFGLNDQPYVGGLLLSDPNDTDLIEPFIVYDSERLVAGGPNGATGNTEIFEVRERFNVTVNEPRDLYFALKLPESPAGITFAAEGYFALVEDNAVCSTNLSIECDTDSNCPADTCGGGGFCNATPTLACTIDDDCTECNTGATGDSLLTPDDFNTFFVTNTFDLIYRVKTETAPAVMITGASPSTVTQGDTGTVVTLSGVGFETGASVEILRPDFGPHLPSGVTITNVNVANSTTVELTVDVDMGATPGPLDVKLVNPEVVIPNWSRVLTVLPDTDGDGVTDADDNCPALSNPGQTDTDADGDGDACDTDDDNDGIDDGTDTDTLNPNVCADSDADTCDDCAVGVDGFGPLADNLPANDGPDLDGDGLCDAGDADVDGDTFDNPVDCMPLDMTLWSTPGSIGNTVQVAFDTGTDALVTWSDPTDLGGTAGTSVSDVTGGLISSLTLSGGTDYGSCLDDDVSTNQYVDATAVGSGDVQFFMVAPENGCGLGPYTGPSGGANRNTNPGNC